MKKAGVIGHPVAHSKSPVIHGYWLEKYGIDGAYQRYDIEPERLKDKVQALVDLGVCGFNVTLPHKVAIMDLCSEISERAQHIGAVNTVSVSADRLLSGDNTDCFGFSQNIKETLPDFRFAGKHALILGAGGASRALIAALQAEQVASIALCNRSADRAGRLAEEFGCGIIPWEARSDCLADIDLLVNSTSLGMTGQPALEIDVGRLPDHAVVSDIVYSPLITPLLTCSQSRGLQTVEGIGMLLHQARPAFERWFGVFPEVDDSLRALVTA